MTPSSCPRCDSNQVEKIADSPVKGKWQAYKCQGCNYIWRSTEDTSRVIKRMDYWRKTAIRYW